MYGDGTPPADSGVKTASQGPSSLAVTTTGYATLELCVTDARNGNAAVPTADTGITAP